MINSVFAAAGANQQRNQKRILDIKALQTRCNADIKLINRCFERSTYCVVEKDGPFPDIRKVAAPSAFGDGMYIFSVSQLSSEFTFFFNLKMTGADSECRMVIASQTCESKGWVDENGREKCWESLGGWR